MVKLSVAAAVAALVSTSAGASPVIWNLDAPLGDLGPSHVYSDSVPGDPAIAATAFGPKSPHLTAKNDGPDEDGLGLTNGSFGEITPGSWIQFDISQLAGRVASADLSFAANSTAGGDVWHVYGSNTQGTLGTSILAGTTDATFDLMKVVGAYAFINVTADAGPTGNGTVLAREFDANIARAVPEPASAALVITGMAGLWWFANRRRIPPRR
jgi:hypothetical protein